MGVIQVTEFMSSGLSRSFNSVSSIDVEDTVIGEGSFGKIYLCDQIDGKASPIPLAIKLLSAHDTALMERGYQTIIHLQEQIIDYSRQQGKPLDKIPALSALPQFSFAGQLNGQLVKGYAARYLDDYFSFNSLFEDGDEATQQQMFGSFYAMPLSKRLKLAYELAEGFNALEKLSFIYADLNPQNLFINLSRATLSLIDYDGGAVINQPGDQAITFGKRGEWLAPEIQEQLRQGNTDKIVVNRETDAWSVAIGIHYLLFPFHPLSYLGTIGKSQTGYYFSHYQWPHIEKTDVFFDADMQQIHANYIQHLYMAVQEIIEGFEITINNGYYGSSQRLGYQQWMQRLGSQLPWPVITDFKADLTHVVPGVPIRLSWQVENAHTVTVDQGVGEVTWQPYQTVYPQHSCIYTLTATGYSGEETFPLRITTFELPSLNIQYAPAKISDCFSLGQVQLKLPEIHIVPPLEELRFGEITSTLDASVASLPNRSANRTDHSGHSGKWSISGIIDYIKTKLSNF